MDVATENTIFGETVQSGRFSFSGTRMSPRGNVRIRYYERNVRPRLTARSPVQLRSYPPRQLSGKQPRPLPPDSSDPSCLPRGTELDKAVLIYPCIGSQGVDQTDVRSLRRLNRAHTSIVRIVNVSHLESGTVSGKTARS